MYYSIIVLYIWHISHISCSYIHQSHIKHIERNLIDWLVPRAGICFTKLAETPSVLLAFEALPSCGDPVKQQLQLIRRVEWHENETHMYIHDQ